MVSWKTRSFSTRSTFWTFKSSSSSLFFAYARSTHPKLKWHTARLAVSTWNSRFLNTRKARTRSRPKVPVVTLLSSQASEDRPSPSSERRPSRPRRSPLDLNAPSARLEDVNYSADARLSFWEPTQPRTSLVHCSELSKASGKATLDKARDELMNRSSHWFFQFFSQQFFLFFLLYTSLSLLSVLSIIDVTLSKLEHAKT